MLCSCCRLLHAVFMLQVTTCCVHVAGCYMLCLCCRLLHAVFILQVATCCVHVAGYYMPCLCCRLLHAVFILQVAICCVHVAGCYMLCSCCRVAICCVCVLQRRGVRAAGVVARHRQVRGADCQPLPHRHRATSPALLERVHQ